MIEKIIDEKNENTSNIVPGIAITALIVLMIFTFTGNGLGSITTYLGEKVPDTSSIPSIIRDNMATNDGSLFDIDLTIPNEYKNIMPENKLIASVELTNFGKSGKTPVSISYIITNANNNIVMIIHENRIVEQQDAFLKEIDIPKLYYGPYRLSIEILYSNTSAFAHEDFNIVAWNQ